jgi:hypothetical protein
MGTVRFQTGSGGRARTPEQEEEQARGNRVGYSRKPAVSINHLFKRMVRFEKKIQLLENGRMDM